MENTDDRSQYHWTLDVHYNKVASSMKINYPSAAHGVRFCEVENIVVCSM
jgi:hypothetical protein